MLTLESVVGNDTFSPNLQGLQLRETIWSSIKPWLFRQYVESERKQFAHIQTERDLLRALGTRKTSVSRDINKLQVPPDAASSLCDVFKGLHSVVLCVFINQVESVRLKGYSYLVLIL